MREEKLERIIEKVENGEYEVLKVEYDGDLSKNFGSWEEYEIRFEVDGKVYTLYYYWIDAGDVNVDISFYIEGDEIINIYGKRNELNNKDYDIYEDIRYLKRKLIRN